MGPGEDPYFWLSELNRLRLKMKNLFNEDINEKSFQLIIINGLPNEYSVTQSQLEFMLDKNEELTLEDIKTHLKSRYERLGKKRHDGALSVNYRRGNGQRYGNNGDNGSSKTDINRRNQPFNKGRLYCTYFKKSVHIELYCLDSEDKKKIS